LDSDSGWVANRAVTVTGVAEDAAGEEQPPRPPTTTSAAIRVRWRLSGKGVAGGVPLGRLRGCRHGDESCQPLNDEVDIRGSHTEDWWAVQDSNLRHPRCKRGALTAELTARAATVGVAQGPPRGRIGIRTRVVPRPGLEPGWIAPYAPQTYAYTNSATWARDTLATPSPPEPPPAIRWIRVLGAEEGI